VWFLDQIAPSACFDTTIGNASQTAGYVDPLWVYDRNYTNDSLILTVTTVKEGGAEYATYTNEVCRSLGSGVRQYNTTRPQSHRGHRPRLEFEAGSL
jgi:hypothetical protein